MNTQELKKIAEKIAKCLALSASTNPHEAETAQRQANALMKKYNLNTGDIAASQVKEQHTPTGGKYQAPPYLYFLAGIVAKAFSCEAIAASGWGFDNSVMKFLGVGYKPELAAYTFNVLRRQLKKVRTAHYATLKRFKPANRTRSANVFCDAWLFNIQKQVSVFAGNEDELQAIAAYKEQNYTHLKKDDRTKLSITDKDHKAIAAGILASKDVALHRPVRSKSGKAIAHQEAV